MVKTIDLTIHGMECPNCAMTLERIEDKLEGVISAEASYHKGRMVVKFDDARVTEEQIKLEVKHLGYEVADLRLRN